MAHKYSGRMLNRMMQHFADRFLPTISIMKKDYTSTIRRLLPNDFIFHETTEIWGVSIFIMSLDGSTMFRYYWYDDAPEDKYIDMVSVSDDRQRKGKGNRVLKIVDLLTKWLGKSVTLWVTKDSWQHDWYKRNGYADTILNESQPGTVWMRKDF